MLFDIFNTGITYTAAIVDDALSYVYSGIDSVLAMNSWVQLAIFVVAALLILVGLFTVLKKAIKAILVIAVLAGIVYVLDMQGIINLQEILDSITGVFSALVFKGTFL